MNYRAMLLVAILLACRLSSLAQYTITGTVADASGMPLPEATMLLLRQSDSSILRTAVPDASGQYSLLIDDTAAQFLHVLAPGFKEQTRTLDDKKSDGIIINFTLSPEDKELAGITVSAQKPLLQRKPDRLIFNISSSITASGGNALDAVRKAPGVRVQEQDNSIILAGKSSVFVLVNDRLLQLSAEDLMAYLQSIPSENIDRIEIITTPPARYDAAGNSGLINIVLKKNRSNGFNGDLRAAYEQSFYGTATAGASLNYRRDKLNAYTSASYSDGSKRVIERLNTDYPGHQQQLSDNYKKTISTRQYTLGVDYALHRNGLLGVQLTGNDFSRNDLSDGRLRSVDLPTGGIDSVALTTATQNNRRSNNIVNLNYEWMIDTTGKKLTVNANRLWLQTDRNKDFTTTNYYGDLAALTGISSTNRNLGAMQIDITTVQADLDLPLKWASISAGGKLSFTVNDSRNRLQHYKDGVYLDDLLVSNEFSYHEQVQAAYISMQKTAGHWGFQAGIRGEATQTKGYSKTIDQTNTNNYFNLFPTAYISYTPGDDHSLNINYSKRINRPGYADLDPFRSYSSPYSYIEGNPFLQPSYNHNIELSYTYKGRYTLSAYYQYEQNHFGHVFFADTVNNGSYVKRANFGNNHDYGVSAVAALSPATWWEVQVQAYGFIQQISSSYYSGIKQEYRLPGFYLSANNSLSLNKTKTVLAELNIFYHHRYQDALFFFRQIASVDAGIRMLLFQKKLTFSLNATDILATMGPRGTNQVTAQTLNSYFDSRNMRLNISYKFGRNSVRPSRRRVMGIEEERQRTQ